MTLVAPSLLPSPPLHWGPLAVGWVRLGAGLLCLAALASPALASSPDAWRAYDREVRTACLNATGLRQARVVGERVDVPVADLSLDGSTLLISALLLEGRFPQPHMGGQKGRELCLFEQRTRKATVATAESLDRPRPKP
jgi:hypothetical protein